MNAQPKHIQAPIILPAVHLSILDQDDRFQVLNAGRGFAKTGVLLAKGLESLTRTYYTPGGIILPNRIMYAAPTMGEAIDIAWERAKEMFDPVTTKKPNESRYEIRLLNNAKFFLRGMKKLNRTRGDYLTCYLGDEFAFGEPDGSTLQDYWQKVIRPMLGKVRPGGEAMFASTPDGHNFFYELYQKGINKDKGWKSHNYKAIEGGFITPEEIADARKDMTEDAWRQEYLAEFIASSGRIYYKFDRNKHCRPVQHVKELEIHWGWDFNVNPSVHSCLSHFHKGKFYVFDEICEGETPDSVIAFTERYKPEDVKAISLYGDYTGTFSTTGITDYQLIDDILVQRGYPKPTLKVYGGNPIERDRTNNVNRLLENAEGDIKIFINPDKCPRLVRDFEQVKRAENGKIDKSANYKLTHSSDGFGYKAHVICPPAWAKDKRPVNKEREYKTEGTTGWRY